MEIYIARLEAEIERLRAALMRIDGVLPVLRREQIHAVVCEALGAAHETPAGKPCRAFQPDYDEGQEQPGCAVCGCTRAAHKTTGSNE